MKFFASVWIAACAAYAPMSHAQGNPAPQSPAATQTVTMVEVVRSTMGRIIDASGLATKPYPANKGEHFTLVSEQIGDVVVQSRGGAKIRFAKSDVALHPGQSAEPVARARPANEDPRAAAAAAAAEAERSAQAAFVPGGTLVIMSAKYSLEGNQARNVKSKVEKLVPAGSLSQMVKILVSDELSRAAANQSSAVTIYQTSNGSYVSHVPAKNILTVVYQYNGQTLTKQAVEGTYLYLP